MKPAPNRKTDLVELSQIEKRLGAVATVAEVQRLISAAAKIGRAGRDVDDAAVVRLAFVVGRRLERQAGLILMKGTTPPEDLSDYTTARWLRLSALSPEAFKARLKAADGRRQRPQSRPALPGVQMRASAWVRDPETGIISREIWAEPANAESTDLEILKKPVTGNQVTTAAANRPGAASTRPSAEDRKAAPNPPPT
jgi:hypothetical protein